MVVASPKARFSLPEAKRGIYAAAGGLARLMRIVGLQIASEIAMTGRVISPEEGKAWQFVNRITKTHESLIEETLELAREISQLSPDALIVTKAGLREAWETGNVEVAVGKIRAQYDRKIYGGENLAEGKTGCFPTSQFVHSFANWCSFQALLHSEKRESLTGLNRSCNRIVCPLYRPLASY